MSFQTLETSRQDAKPVELYQFTRQALPLGGGAGIPAPPAAPGNVVIGDMLVSGSWSVVRDLGQTTLSPTYPPTSPDSYAAWPGAAGQWEVWAAYHGAIGGGGAYFYESATFGTANGLTPNTTYVLRILGQTTAGGAPPIFGYDINGSGPIVPGPSSGAYPANNLSWHDYTFTTGTSPSLVIHVGALDLEVGNADILIVPAMVLFDATGTPAGGGQPGGTGSGAQYAATTLNYTSADRDIVYATQTYVKALIIRDRLGTTSDAIEKGELQIKVHVSETIASWFVPGILTIAPIVCQMHRLHRDDLTDAIHPIRGQITHVNRSDDYLILTMSDEARLLLRRGPRTLIQRVCNNILYDNICGLSPTNFAFNGTVSAVDAVGIQLTIPGAGAHVGADLTFFNNGMLQFSNGRRVGIAAATGDTILVTHAVPEAIPGALVTLYAGCDGTLNTCRHRFNNAAHRRGFDYLPLANPFVGAGLS